MQGTYVLSAALSRQFTAGSLVSILYFIYNRKKNKPVPIHHIMQFKSVVIKIFTLQIQKLFLAVYV
jgi:hypothetical protein